MKKLNDAYEWMKKIGCYDKFMDEISLLGLSDERLLKLYMNDPKKFIASSFSWVESIYKQEYWIEINKEYQKLFNVKMF